MPGFDAKHVQLQPKAAPTATLLSAAKLADLEKQLKFVPVTYQPFYQELAQRMLCLSAYDNDLLLLLQIRFGKFCHMYVKHVSLILKKMETKSSGSGFVSHAE